ncbi:ABC transporter permease subunit [Streptomyces sp. NPDC053741]|uniref:Binding-protein-dependent transport systems inner membrane component n=2 Tax=Streptomyces TaxID=1883 RepID=A0A8D4BFA6_STRFA|nr:MULTISPECIES: ABC transporter permease subunit [Streptomyces]MBD2834760.1 ABC transporter permease subunit [Streptomyces pratensis]RAS28904.1 glycine betaine/proline transport system permease protein [Streptomyces avidinii]SNX78701.1 glycine betaine/proline transport system permease protein [Streptomyces microflavus]MCX4416915.1 ABC transporter permease subunit [[Kitasatospora] papulosa]MCY1654811.1 ABC transporter permease subunit [Streptomyces sp. SL203]
MATAQATTRTASGPPGKGALAALRERPALAKILALLVVAAVAVPLAHARWGGGVWPGALTVDLSGPLGEVNDWIIGNRDSHPLFLYFFGHISNAVVLSVRGVYLALLALGWAGVTAVAALVAWRTAGWRLALTAGLSFLLCGLLGMWVPTMQTLALMVVAVLVSVVLGLLLGLAGGLSDRTFRVLRPVLDTMQVLPAFAYLLPVVLVFGIGVPGAVLATVVYAAPPMARLTALGLRGADPGVMEAVASLGATGRQRLLSARLPLARKELLLGLNQTIMMALSMAVIASVIGAGGLGDRVYQALSSVDVGAALAAGIPIVLLAVVLDRTTEAAGRRIGAEPTGPAALRGARGWGLAALIAAAVAVVGRFTGGRIWPEGTVVPIAEPVNTAKDWMVDHLYTGVPVIGGTADWAAHFTNWVLNPLRDGLQGLPWWAVLLIVAALAWTIGTWRTAATAVLAMAAIGVLGVWDLSMDTLSQVVAAVAVTLVLGFGIAVGAARSRRLERLLRPVLDVFQTMPQFVYLIPVVALFGVGRAPAAAAAVVYALPAVVRITTQGLRGVDPAAMECARSLGATSGQRLRQVQIPLARPALLLAVNQGVVLVLAVVIIGGLVGSGALGYEVVFGLAQGDLATGLVAGAAIVCLGLMLDRVTQPTTRRQRKES